MELSLGDTGITDVLYVMFHQDLSDGSKYKSLFGPFIKMDHRMKLAYGNICRLMDLQSKYHI
jgi:hypothetical protein